MPLLRLLQSSLANSIARICAHNRFIRSARRGVAPARGVMNELLQPQPETDRQPIALVNLPGITQGRDQLPYVHKSFKLVAVFNQRRALAKPELLSHAEPELGAVPCDLVRQVRGHGPAQSIFAVAVAQLHAF